MNSVFLSIGSNINPQINITKIIKFIEKSSIFSNILISDYFYSNAVGFNSENKFINIMIYCQTELSATNLLIETQNIEQKLNRKRSVNEEYIDRTADIDIIFYNDEIINTEKLKIPHIHWENREFVKTPLKNLISKDNNLKRKNRWVKNL